MNDEKWNYLLRAKKKSSTFHRSLHKRARDKLKKLHFSTLSVNKFGTYSICLSKCLLKLKLLLPNFNKIRTLVAYQSAYYEIKTYDRVTLEVLST